MSRRTRAWANGPFGGSAGGAAVGGTIPSPLGVAAAGASVQAARADHVHVMPSAADIGAAPTSAQYLALATDATLTHERVFAPDYGIAGVDGGAGATYQCMEFYDAWEMQTTTTPSSYLESAGRVNSSNFSNAVTLSIAAGVGRHGVMLSTGTASWFGMVTVNAHCPFVGVIRWFCVIRTQSDVNEMRMLAGLTSVSLSGTPADLPSSGGDYMFIRIASGATTFDLLTRDNTSTTATAIADVTITANTTYALEMVLDQTAVTPIIKGRVWTFSGVATWTPGAWYSHTTTLPRTSAFGGDVWAMCRTGSNNRAIGIGRIRGYTGVAP